jgi:hypothetical protein
VHNVAAPGYSDYIANQGQRQLSRWPQNYTPEFQDPAEAAEEAYASYYGGFYAQDELSVHDARVGLTYGHGIPHRRQHQVFEAAPAQVETNFNEWWTPVHFSRADYLFKVDTGARVNVMSVADLSRIGFDFCDLAPSSVLLMGFNKAIVKPRGRLETQIRVNGVAFRTIFQVVDQCNSPLLCLRDAARAGLVTIASAYQPAPVSEFSFYKHEIVNLKLKPEAVPKQFPPRKVPLALQPAAKAQLQEMLDDGVIERVTEPSAWCHPMQIAFKPDGRLRICMDPRYLNQFLERAIFPFPSLDNVFSSVRGAKFFSKIDLTWGFWNLRLDEESARLCTFVTPWGVFRYRRLPFGVSPAPEVFHRVLADVLRDLPGVLHYVDDVLIYGATREEHNARLRAVLQRIKAAGFNISESKSSFAKTEVVFLGHLISGTAIRPDPAKVKALQEMKPPTCISEHRGLLGFVNFLSQYLPHYSALTEPLQRLQSAKTHFRWTEDQQRSFDLLKELFCTGTVFGTF